MIFAPCPFHREEKAESGESESVDGIFFKAVHVFDVAQTDGKELPDVDCPVVDADASMLLNGLERVAGKRGIAVKFESLGSKGFGYAGILYAWVTVAFVETEPLRTDGSLEFVGQHRFEWRTSRVILRGFYFNFKEGDHELKRIPAPPAEAMRRDISVVRPDLQG